MKRLRLPICLLVIALLSILVAANAAAPPLANDVILIVRHAEKPDVGADLTPVGRKRASAYVRYFEAYRIDAKSSHLDELFASADTARSRRPRLTVEPLSKALNLPIDDRFRDKDVDALAQAIRTQSGGKTILICWHHGEIPALLQALGADPDALLPDGRWPPDVYDWVIELRYDSHGHLPPGHAARISENLLPGDAD